MGETVYIATRRGTSGDKKIYHTRGPDADEPCPQLQNIITTIPKDRDVLGADWAECQFCAGEVDTHTHDGNPCELRDALLETDPEEVGLSPIGEREVPDPSETVFVRSTNAGGLEVYHTSRDCSGLQDAQTVFEREYRHLPAGVRLCRLCDGTAAEYHSDPDWSYQNALREAAEGD
jgi:hypothetical protein